jgi:hypothetical protein
MKKIIIMTDRADELSPFMHMIGQLFPDCEISAVPRDKSCQTGHNLDKMVITPHAESNF